MEKSKNDRSNWVREAVSLSLSLSRFYFFGPSNINFPSSSILSLPTYVVPFFSLIFGAPAFSAICDPSQWKTHSHELPMNISFPFQKKEKQKYFMPVFPLSHLFAVVGSTQRECMWIMLIPCPEFIYYSMAAPFMFICFPSLSRACSSGDERA